MFSFRFAHAFHFILFCLAKSAKFPQKSVKIMAKLLSYYNVCTIANQNEFLGLSGDKSDDHLIISIGRNLVYTLAVST